MDCETVEQKISEKGLNGPRVTKEQIDNLVSQFTYDIHQVEGTTTFVATCFLDGFSLAVGVSACVDPSNFDREIGIGIAKRKATQQATDKLWELEGYALRKALNS